MHLPAPFPDTAPRSSRQRLGAWLKPLWRYLAFIAVLYAYMVLMEGFGGFNTSRVSDQLIELGLVLYFYSLFHAILKPSRWRGVLAGVPILLIYLTHDIFYLAHGKVFRIINVAELPELLQVLPLSYTLLLCAILFLPIGALLATTNYQRPATLVLWLAPLTALVFFVTVSPNAFAHRFQQLAAEIVTWSDGKSVEANGRIAMLLYREALRISALEQLEPYRDRAGYDQQVEQLAASLKPHANRRNVHLIVLESFLDPRLFRDLKLSESPVHPDFERLFGDRLGLSRSPLFGGGTAQAEFEVLCGVPAFEKLSSVEFNAFTGAPAQCLPALLQRLDYRSVASNAYKPNFFNAIPGYQGTGFAESYFPREFYGTNETYLEFGDTGAEEFLFDADLFAQNLAFVKRHLEQQPGRPLFNYIMTVYGHTPHPIDPARRPERIQMLSSHTDEHLQRSVNQFYYRTEAIAHYVRQLLALDPNSLIILVSDHVPPLLKGPNTYNALKYMDNIEDSSRYNRLIIVENGETKVYPPIFHYELPQLVLNYVSDGGYCSRQPCAFLDPGKRVAKAELLDDYMVLMAHASE